ncbi:MAG: hypothetical protein ACJ760_16295 [Thermoleophilaceae bacterium]
MGVRNWIAAPVGALVTALALVATALAASNVPTVKDLHANPNRFCAKRSDGCSHPGTTIRFTVDTAAKVRGVIRPRFEPTGNLVEFNKQFPAGTNHVRVNDTRLRPGTWVLRLQGTNAVGTGGVAVLHVHVVKGD